MRASLKSEWFAMLLWLLITPCRAMTGEVSEHMLKAAFLYNFAVYTEWPSLPVNFQICIVGQDRFGAALDALTEKEIAGRAIRINRLLDENVPLDCNLVFITEDKLDHLPEIVKPLAGAPILTVSETTAADPKLVMLRMKVERGFLVFDASPSTAKSSGLTLSARMLRLAHRIY